MSLVSSIAGITAEAKEIWAASANIDEILSKADEVNRRLAGAKNNNI